MSQPITAEAIESYANCLAQDEAFCDCKDLPPEVQADLRKRARFIIEQIRRWKDEG